MFSSADQRANIKKDLIYLAIGGAFVFGATTIVKFVVTAANDIM